MNKEPKEITARPVPADDQLEVKAKPAPTEDELEAARNAIKDAVIEKPATKEKSKEPTESELAAARAAIAGAEKKKTPREHLITKILKKLNSGADHILDKWHLGDNSAGSGRTLKQIHPEWFDENGKRIKTEQPSDKKDNEPAVINIPKKPENPDSKATKEVAKDKKVSHEEKNTSEAKGKISANDVINLYLDTNRANLGSLNAEKIDNFTNVLKAINSTFNKLEAKGGYDKFPRVYKLINEAVKEESEGKEGATAKMLEELEALMNFS